MTGAIEPPVAARRMSRADIDLLRAALLDGDAAISAFRAWRPTLDLATLPYGHQRLLPLLQRNMTRLGIEDPYIERFRGIRRYFWVRNLRSMALARSLFEALNQGTVPFIVLKGAALIAGYLDDRSLRPMDDIDILVRDEHVPEAVAILAARGLFPALSDERQLPQERTQRFLRNERVRSNLAGWQFVGHEQNIDLHWRALHLDRRPEADARFWRDSRTVDFDGLPVRVLDPAHHLLHLCAHAAQDRSGSSMQQWAADATTIIRGSPDLSWDRVVEEARARHVSRIVGNSLAFLVAELDLPIPPATIRRLLSAGDWSERAEARLRALGAEAMPPASRTFLAFQDYRRGTGGNLLDRRAISVAPAFLKAWTGGAGSISLGAIALQAMLGHPRWLRRLTGRDRFRAVPDRGRLPRVGEAIDLFGLPAREAALVAGWGLPEASGRWTVAREATTAWRVDAADGDLDLLVDGDPFLVGDKPHLDVEIWANDRLVETLLFRPGETSPLPARMRLKRRAGRGGILFLTFLFRRSRLEPEPGLGSASTFAGSRW